MQVRTSSIKHKGVTTTSCSTAVLLLCLSGAHNDDVIIVLQCLDAMLTRRRKQVTLQRVMAFIKRLNVLSLHTLPNASVGVLSTNRALLHVSVFPGAAAVFTFSTMLT